MDIRVVVVCATCQVHWDADRESAKCTNYEHAHRRIELHRHRSPDYGLYLDYQWQPPWPHDHLDWPDFGVPESTEDVSAALRSVLDRAHAGQRVEIGCLGGHGRTGTALACLAILTGHPARGAVDWVRAVYCASAVETPEQEAFVAAYHG